MKETSATRIPRDLVAGVLFLIVGIAGLVAIPSTVVAVRMEFGVGPRFVPRWSVIIIILLSVLLIVKSIISWLRGGGQLISLMEVIPTVEAFGVVGLIALWVISLRWIPYLPVSVIVTVLGLRMFRVTGWSRYAVGVGFVVITWLAFTFLLNVRLP